MFVFVHSAAVRYLGTTGENYSGQLELLKHTKNVVTFKRRLDLLSKLYHLASALFFFSCAHLRQVGQAGVALDSV